MRRRFTLLVVTVAIAAIGAPALADDASAVPDAHPLHHAARDHRAGKGSQPLATTSYAYGYQPSDLTAAYGVPAGGTGRTVAIVDAYDNPKVEADLGVYRKRFGLPACTTANGCFRKLNQRGGMGPYPPRDVGWGQEIALDLDMVSAACPACRILLVEADSASLNSLAAAVDKAAALGAVAISNSYGANEWSGETAFQSHWNHPGVAITASAGDSGFGVEFPAAAGSVIAVGGTRLTRSSTARGWTETAWTGSGSGCSAYIAKPAWQQDTGCGRRTVADVAAVADPNTGVAVYDSYGSKSGANWWVFGGTSVSAPIVAALFAVAGNTNVAYNGSYIYARATSLWDTISGTNGVCGVPYLCTALAGYDGPTGLGTPQGIGAL